jgi:hypothetical protein
MNDCNTPPSERRDATSARTTRPLSRPVKGGIR